MQKQKGVSTLILIIVIIAVAVVAVGGVLAYQSFSTKTKPVVQTQQNQNQNNQTAGWKTYTNTQYGFEFQYPSNYQVGQPGSNLVKLPDKTNIAELFGSPDNILITYATGSNLDLSNAKYGTDKIYFDESANQWMRTLNVGLSNNTATSKETPLYTIAGLPYFGNMRGVSSGEVVALSHDKFVIISAADSGPIRDIITNIASTFKFTK